MPTTATASARRNGDHSSPRPRQYRCRGALARALTAAGMARSPGSNTFVKASPAKGSTSDRRRQRSIAARRTEPMPGTVARVDEGAAQAAARLPNRCHSLQIAANPNPGTWAHNNHHIRSSDDHGNPPSSSSTQGRSTTAQQYRCTDISEGPGPESPPPWRGRAAGGAAGGADQAPPRDPPTPAQRGLQPPAHPPPSQSDCARAA